MIRASVGRMLILFGTGMLVSVVAVQSFLYFGGCR